MYKHTPGPWGVGEKHCDRGNTLITSPKDYICEVYDYNNDEEMTAEESEGNANLVAAALILLEACQHVLYNLTEESPEIWEHEIAHLQYAVDKAIGVN